MEERIELENKEKWQWEVTVINIIGLIGLNAQNVELNGNK
jgi:hypothetical protein